jgi:basic membrane protein A and related proteins
VRRVMKLAAGAVTAALVVAGCGGDEPGTGTASPSGDQTAASSVKVGLAYDVGGRGDQSFNDAAAAGLDKAKAELGVQATEAEATSGEPESAREERLRLLAEDGYNPVIGVGFAYTGAMDKVAAEFPETQFAIVDGPDAKDADNVAKLLFAEEQGSFLVGAAAALKSRSGIIGFVGGVEVPLIKKFEAGYTAGAKAVDPDVEVQVKYLTQPPNFDGFRDPARGKTAAEGMYDAGADVVYHAAGGSGGGVFEAAKAAGGKAIGVDSDQYETADPKVRDVIITSMLKKVDVAVFDFISSVVGGSFQAGEVRYDLERGGIDYSTSGGMVDDIKDRLDDYKQKIIGGEIQVPTAP